MPVNLDAHAFRLFLPNRLSSEDVFHFTGANPESQRPKSSMGRRVGIPADDGFPGLGQAHFRSHHVDDALAFRAVITKFHPKLGTILPQGINLLFRNQIGNIVNIHRGHIVVHGAEDFLRTAHGAPSFSQSFKGLG